MLYKFMQSKKLIQNCRSTLEQMQLRLPTGTGQYVQPGGHWLKIEEFKCVMC